MKNLIKKLMVSAFAFAFAGMISISYGADVVSISAGGAAGGVSAEGWTEANSGTSGTFTGASGWGLWANDSGGTAAGQADIYRSLAGGDLLATQKINLKMTFPTTVKNDSGNKGIVGITLRKGGVDRFELFFKGGDSFFTIKDGTSERLTTLGYSSSPLDFSLTLNADNTYAFSLGGTSLETAGVLNNSGFDIDTVRVFNYNPGGAGAETTNFLINDLAVTAVTVPEPSTYALIVGGLFFLGFVFRRRLVVSL